MDDAENDPDNGDLEDVGEAEEGPVDDDDDGLLDGATGHNHNRGGLRASSPNDAATDDEVAIVRCATTAGPITLHLHKSWSPNGYEKASSLFERGYYDGSHLFRVVPHFLVQFGISYTTDAELKRFADASVPDDPKRNDLMPFREGYISFAGSGPHSRTSQLFVAYDRSQGLGNSPWETPFGEVAEGMEKVRNFYSGYGDMPPWGKGPEQGPIRNRGSKYIEENFPLLDRFETCTVERVGSLEEGEGAMDDGPSGEEASPVIAAPRKMKEDAALAETENSFPLAGVIVIVVGSLILGGVLARRTKQAGKHV
ncbi:hypothetical protein ACHAXT_000725 [Thalassiosira profunda]